MISKRKKRKKKIKGRIIRFSVCSIMNNNSVEQPDPDNIKMFVGQVPHDMDENDLRKLFEEFGRVHQINILRDKITGSHRGECSIDTAPFLYSCRSSPSSLRNLDATYSRTYFQNQNQKKWRLGSKIFAGGKLKFVSDARNTHLE